MNRNSRATGFTLIEVLLVIGILLVLGTVAVVAYPRIKEGADKNSAKVMVDNVVQAVELYHTVMNVYPTTEDGLKALTEVPSDEKLAEKWKNGGGPFLKDGQIPNDPWGQPIKYEKVETSGTGGTTGAAFHVWSSGPDMQDNNEDDIRSWSDAAAQ